MQGRGLPRPGMERTERRGTAWGTGRGKPRPTNQAVIPAPLTPPGEGLARMQDLRFGGYHLLAVNWCSLVHRGRLNPGVERAFPIPNPAKYLNRRHWMLRLRCRPISNQASARHVPP
jgi:hypothetical protein